MIEDFNEINMNLIDINFLKSKSVHFIKKMYLSL